MNDVDSLMMQLATARDFALPDAYVALLRRVSFSVTVTRRDNPASLWRMATAIELQETVKVDGKLGFEWQTVELLGRSAAEATRIEPRVSTNQSFAFASYDGDYLFFAPDLSVNVFHHDGAHIRRVYPSYTEFERDVEWPRMLANDQPPLTPHEIPLVGTWIAKSSRTESDAEFFEIIAPTIELHESRLARYSYKDGSGFDGHWQATDTKLTIQQDGTDRIFTFTLADGTLDLIWDENGDHMRLVKG